MNGKIISFLNVYLQGQGNKPDESAQKNFNNSHPSIKKRKRSKFNIKKNSSKSEIFSLYQSLIKFVLNEFYQPKPVVSEFHFFPNTSNEEKVVSMIRTSKKPLDSVIFSLILDSIVETILEAF